MATELRFDPPEGIIRVKYVDARDNDDFPEHGITGPFATAKTTMGLDFLMRRGFEYPGINQLLARATLKSLKGSSLVALERRWGTFFLDNGGSMNRNEGLYRLPAATHPVDGTKVQSTIQGVGLDRVDLEHIMRSAEYGGAMVEEADEVPSDAIDIVQFRSRQNIWHRSKTVKDLAIKLSQSWGIHPDLVYDILLADKRHPVGLHQCPLDHPMPGSTVMKLFWNPTEDNDIWRRMIGMPYPKPNPTPDWVKSNVGVSEVRLPWEEVERRQIVYYAGVIVMLPERFVELGAKNRRRFVARHDVKAGLVHLVPDPEDPNGPMEVNEEDTMLVVQRNATYVFPRENESRDHANTVNSALAQNAGLARKFFAGEAPERSGRVFDGYVDDYVENGGHLLRWPGKRYIAERGYPIVGGIDKGGRHAHSTVCAIVTPETQTAIIYAEYAKHGIGARDHALDSRELILPGARSVTWGYDPSLDARRYDTDADYRTIEEYEEVLGEGSLFHGIRGDEGFELVQRLLMPHSNYIGEKPMPKLLVFDNMTHVREMMKRLTWRMVDKERDNYLVDVADAVKYMAGMIRMANMHANLDTDDIFKPALAF